MTLPIEDTTRGELIRQALAMTREELMRELLVRGSEEALRQAPRASGAYYEALGDLGDAVARVTRRTYRAVSNWFQS